MRYDKDGEWRSGGWGKWGHTDVDASARAVAGALVADEVLHPVDVVEAQRHGGDEALQGDLDGQAKVLLQQGAGESPHRLRVLKVQPAGRTRGTGGKKDRQTEGDSGREGKAGRQRVNERGRRGRQGRTQRQTEVKQDKQREDEQEEKYSESERERETGREKMNGKGCQNEWQREKRCERKKG